MTPGRIEISQQCPVPVFPTLALLLKIVTLSFDVVSDQRLDSGFCAAIRICGSDGTYFWDGNHVFETCSISIDGGRGGEDDIRDIMASHRREKTDGAIDVCPPVFQGNLSRFAYSLGTVSTDSKLPVSTMPVSGHIR